MPLYEYECPNGHRFEDLQTMANRHHAECMNCGKMADMKISPVRLDPNADLPSARDTWQRKASERGRGKDMTSANKTVESESIDREAHAQRAALGENPIY